MADAEALRAAEVREGRGGERAAITEGGGGMKKQGRKKRKMMKIHKMRMDWEEERPDPEM